VTNWIITSWNGTNPQHVSTYEEAVIIAETRRKTEGHLIRVSQAKPDKHFDFIYFREVGAAGNWSGWLQEPLRGSLSELDANERDAEGQFEDSNTA
jgi:hypothetical protein